MWKFIVEACDFFTHFTFQIYIENLQEKRPNLKFCTWKIFIYYFIKTDQTCREYVTVQYLSKMANFWKIY